MTYYQPTPEEREERYNGLLPYDYWNERVWLGIIATFGKPATYLDMGSGSGAMVKFARGCGVDAIGIDVIASEPDIAHDLRLPIDLNRTFQLVTSIEVAEHLPEENAETFVQNIARHMSEGSILVFTAALPNQPGDNHVNCQPKQYWKDLFAKCGVVFSQSDYDMLYAMWMLFVNNIYVTSGPNTHLAKNLQVFRKV